MKKASARLSLAAHLLVSSILASASVRADPICATDAAVINRLNSRFLQQGSLRSGGAADILTEQGREQLCRKGEVSRLLPSVCASALESQALEQFRQRLIFDLATIPQQTLQGNTDHIPPEQKRRVRTGLALLGGLLSEGNLSPLARLLVGPVHLRGGRAFCTVRSPKAERLLQISSGHHDDALVAAKILENISREIADLPGEEDVYFHLIEQEVRPFRPWDTTARLRAKRLVQELKRLEKTRRTARSNPSLEADLELLQAVTAVIEAALTVSSGQPVRVPAEYLDFAEQLIRGQLERVLATAASMAPHEPSQEALRLIQIAVKIATIKDQASLEQQIKSLIFPWSEAWLVDLNGSIPKIQGDSGASNLKLFGDLSLGYHGKTWGLAGRAMYSLYNHQESFIVQRNSRAIGALEGWYEWTLSDSIKTEARLSGGSTYYGTRYDNQIRSQFQLNKENSLLGRGTLLGALRYTPSATLALGFWLGFGGQYEQYQSDNFISRGNQSSAIQHTTQLIAESRFRFQWSILPGYLGVRARADATRFFITRDRQFFQIAETIEDGTSTTEATQIDASGRIFADIEWLELGGFLPALHAGLDAYWQRADGQSQTTIVPLAGFGVRRDTF